MSLFTIMPPIAFDPDAPPRPIQPDPAKEFTVDALARLRAGQDVVFRRQPGLVQQADFIIGPNRGDFPQFASGYHRQTLPFLYYRGAAWPPPYDVQGDYANVDGLGGSDDDLAWWLYHTWKNDLPPLMHPTNWWTEIIRPAVVWVGSAMLAGYTAGSVFGTEGAIAGAAGPSGAGAAGAGTAGIAAEGAGLAVAEVAAATVAAEGASIAGILGTAGTAVEVAAGAVGVVGAVSAISDPQTAPSPLAAIPSQQSVPILSQENQPAPTGTTLGVLGLLAWFIFV